MALSSETCPLCLQDGGRLIWRNENLRIIAVDDEAHPGFTRVVWNQHVAEMTELPPHARQALMAAVWQVEQIQREILRPDKVNLAQFGNMVPHLHWHIIPRWATDSHYPEAIWAQPPARSHMQSEAWVQHKSQLTQLLPEYWAALQQCCNFHT